MPWQLERVRDIGRVSIATLLPRTSERERVHSVLQPRLMSSGPDMLSGPGTVSVCVISWPHAWRVARLLTSLTLQTLGMSHPCFFCNGGYGEVRAPRALLRLMGYAANH